MPTDYTIALNAKPAQIESPLNSLTQVLQMQQGMQNNQLGQLKLDEYARQKDRSNKLVQLMQQLPASATDEDRMNALKGSGYFDEADKLQAGQLARQKTSSEAEAKNIETAHKKIDLFGQTMAFVKQNPTPENANAALDHLAQFGIVNADQVAQYKAQIAANPASVAQLAEMGYRSALNAKDQLPQLTSTNLGGSTQMASRDPLTGKVTVNSMLKNTQSPDSAASVAATLQGQRMTDAREREKMRLEQNQPKLQFDSERGMLVDTRTGQTRPVIGADQKPIGEKDKGLNEGQSKALLFGSRMKEADNILKTLEKEGTTTSVVGSRAPLIGGALTALSSENQQMLDQAKRDFMTAVLRRESGAAISSGEFDTAEKQYFPQIGDSKQVIDQKAKNRDLAIRGVLVEVPEKHRQSLSKTNSVTEISPTVSNW